MKGMHFGFALNRWGFQASPEVGIVTQVSITLPMEYQITTGSVGEAVEELEAFIEQAQAKLAELRGMVK